MNYVKFPYSKHFTTAYRQSPNHAPTHSKFLQFADSPWTCSTPWLSHLQFHPHPSDPTDTCKTKMYLTWTVYTPIHLHTRMWISHPAPAWPTDHAPSHTKDELISHHISRIHHSLTHSSPVSLWSRLQQRWDLVIPQTDPTRLRLTSHWRSTPLHATESLKYLYFYIRIYVHYVREVLSHNAVAAATVDCLAVPSSNTGWR